VPPTPWHEIRIAMSIVSTSCTLLCFHFLLIILMPSSSKQSYPPSAVQKECQRLIHLIAHGAKAKTDLSYEYSTRSLPGNGMVAL
jgi:hypothetical protein